MLAMVADSLKYQGQLYEFANIMSVSLTEKVYLRDLIDRYNNDDKKSGQDGEQFLPFNFWHFVSLTHLKRENFNC